MRIVRVAPGTIRKHMKFRERHIEPPTHGTAAPATEVRAQALAEIEFGIPRWREGETGRQELADIYARARGVR